MEHLLALLCEVRGLSQGWSLKFLKLASQITQLASEVCLTAFLLGQEQLGDKLLDPEESLYVLDEERVGILGSIAIIILLMILLNALVSYGLG